MRAKRLFPLACVLATGVLFSAGTTLAADQDLDFAARVDGYLRSLENLGFAGVVLITAGDEVLLDEGYGLADREAETAWSSRTVSTVGSITKQFTAAAILQLEERGLLSTDDPITRYLKDVPDDKVNITLHHLLTHSSGIVDIEGYGDFDPVSREDIVRLTLEAPLAFEPGGGYEYSNAGYSLLGAIIEQRTGKPYEQYVRESLLLPAGMKDTGYILPRWDETRLAVGYKGAERWGTLLGRPMADDGPYWILRANGGIHSTALDMRYWAEALLDHRVLDPESRAKLWTGYVDEGGGSSFYGYGWVLEDGPTGEPLVMHNGGNGIFFADFVILPERRAVIFLQTNVAWEMRGVEGLARELVENWLVGAPFPEVPPVVEVDPARWETFPGTYALENGNSVLISLDREGLAAETGDQDAHAFLHSGEEPDLERAREYNSVIDGVLAGYVQGDYQPMFESYQGRVPLERLQTRGEEGKRRRERMYGPLQGYDVLGTGFRGERVYTAARLNHEQRSLFRLYVWESDGTLLGYSPRMDLPVTRFFPVGDGRFRSWESESRTSALISFSFEEDGTVTLVMGDGAAGLRAVKKP
jgi:CubicO group peptidase (beta-lactamase class C family)